MAGAGSLSAKNMLGEYGVYCDSKMFAIVADDEFFIKPMETGRTWISKLGAPQEAPPYPQAKSYFLISGELWDEREWLVQLAQYTTAELPIPKPTSQPKPKLESRQRPCPLSPLSRLCD